MGTHSFLSTDRLHLWMSGRNSGGHLCKSSGQVTSLTLECSGHRFWRSPSQSLMLSLENIKEHKIYHLKRWNGFMCSLHLRVLKEKWWIIWEILFSRTIPLGMLKNEQRSSLLETLHLKAPRQSERTGTVPCKHFKKSLECISALIHRG